MTSTEASGTVDDQDPIETLIEWIFDTYRKAFVEKKIRPLLQNKRGRAKNIQLSHLRKQITEVLRLNQSSSLDNLHRVFQHRGAYSEFETTIAQKLPHDLKTGELHDLFGSSSRKASKKGRERSVTSDGPNHERSVTRPEICEHEEIKLHSCPDKRLEGEGPADVKAQLATFPYPGPGPATRKHLEITLIHIRDILEQTINQQRLHVNWAYVGFPSGLDINGGLLTVIMDGPLRLVLDAIPKKTGENDTWVVQMAGKLMSLEIPDKLISLDKGKEDAKEQLDKSQSSCFLKIRRTKVG
jgi:hypothetical protein